METKTLRVPGDPTTSIEDAWLFGSDQTRGIVSIYANREGIALVWRREGESILYERVRFRPWLYAASLADLAHVKASVLPEAASNSSTALVTYRVLNGPEGSFRYLLRASDGRKLERLLLEGASRRLGRQITSLNDLQGDYYRVGPVEQYLMQSGRVYFRGLAYESLHRLQFDLVSAILTSWKITISRNLTSLSLKPGQPPTVPRWPWVERGAPLFWNATRRGWAMVARTAGGCATA